MIQDSKIILQRRLERIWEPAKFSILFENSTKRPPLSIKKGNIIFYEGDQPDRLYFIKEGYVKMYHSAKEGRDAIIYLYGPGSLLGVRALTSQDHALRHNAEAITDVKIITITRKDYLDMIVDHPEFLVDLLHIFIDRLNYTERKLEGFILADALARVSSFLSDCAARFGKNQGKKVILPLPLTHQLISEFVGSFRETVTNALNRLEKDRIIRLERGKVTILDLKKLNKYAQPSKTK